MKIIRSLIAVLICLPFSSQSYFTTDLLYPFYKTTSEKTAVSVNFDLINEYNPNNNSFFTSLNLYNCQDPCLLFTRNAINILLFENTKGLLFSEPVLSTVFNDRYNYSNQNTGKPRIITRYYPSLPVDHSARSDSNEATRHLPCVAVLTQNYDNRQRTLQGRKKSFPLKKDMINEELQKCKKNCRCSKTEKLNNSLRYDSVHYSLFLG